MELLGYFLAALVGVSLGLIGGGGSILTVPILVYVIGVDPILATSYSLFIVGFTSLVGAYYNYRKGFVNIKTALLFGLSSITTVFLIRKLLVPVIPDTLLAIGNILITKAMATMLLFAILMFMASLAMIRDKNPNIEFNPRNAAHHHIAKLLLHGVLIGIATGLLGAGGGFLIIPALVIILKMQMKEAVGTSLLIIALNSLIGFTGDIGNFPIQWGFLIMITLIAIIGIFVGGFLAHRVEGHKLKKAFGWFVLGMGIYIITREIFFHPAMR